MFCTKCGQSNPESAAFCSACGNALWTAPQPEAAARQHAPIPPQEPAIPPPHMSTATQNPQGYGAGALEKQGFVVYDDGVQQSYSQQGADAPPKKSRPGLTAALAAGAAVLTSAAVLLFIWLGFLVQNDQVNGLWYSKDRGEALEFKDNGSVDVYTTYDEYEGGYTYDRTRAIGVISVEGERYDFAVTNDGLYVQSMGKYNQAETDFDVDDFIDDMTSSFSGVDGGNTASSLISSSQISNNNSTVTDNSDVQGMWDETTGYGGTIVFCDGGTYDMTIAGYTFGGIYEYDAYRHGYAA